MLLPAVCLLALQSQGSERLLAGVPADAMAVVALHDLDALRARGRASAWWGLMHDPEVRPLTDKLVELMSEGFEEGWRESEEEDGGEDEELPFDPLELFDAFHGSAVLFVVGDFEEEGPSGMGVLLHPGEPAEAFLGFWDLLREYGRDDEGVSLSTQDYEGVELSFEEREDQLTISFEDGGVLGFVQGEERAVVLELAQGAIDRMRGDDPSPGFGGSAALADARRTAPLGHAVEFFMDPRGLFESTFDSASEALETSRAMASGGEASLEGDEAVLFHSFLERLGVLSLRWMYMAFDVGEGERFELTLSGHVPPGSLIQALLGLMGPVPTELLALAPADAAGFQLSAFDLAGLYDLMVTEMRAIAPDKADQAVQGLEGFEAMMGVDLEDDVLAQLRGGFASLTLPVPEHEVTVDPDLGEELSRALAWEDVIVVTLEDGYEFEDVLARLLRAAGIGGMVEETDYLGFTVQQLDEEGTLQWACTEGALLVSPSATALRAALARVGDSELPTLAADPRCQAILRLHPDARMVRAFDARTGLESVLNLASTGIELSRAGGEADEDMLELLRLLPPASVLARHIEGLVYNVIEIGAESAVLRTGGR